MSDEPEIRKGLAGVTVDVTSISKVNPETNSLLYRGYPVQELAAQKSFEEVAWLLWHGDLPTEEELAALAADAAQIVKNEVPGELRESTEHGIAVAGTATTLAAIDQELDPYDRDRVHGYRLGLAACERILRTLAGLPLAARRKVTGLDPDRAPSIVAGAGILVESIQAFGLDGIEISEADILHGAALAANDGALEG